MIHHGVIGVGRRDMKLELDGCDGYVNSLSVGGYQTQQESKTPENLVQRVGVEHIYLA